MSDKNSRQTGHVDFVDRRKGFGFIRPQGGGPRAFWHVSDIASDDDRLAEGDLVEYRQEPDGKGVRAREIRRRRGW